MDRIYSQLRSFGADALAKLPNAQQLLQLSQIPALVSSPTSYAGSCPNAQLSCHNVSEVSNLCCFNYPGGQLLQTQFWDTSPPVGPTNSWTIHGLWPDHCDGTFDQYCDKGRQYENITDILSSFGNTALMDFMSKYWLPDEGTAEHFYEHEWGKHGTCISTLDTSCYPPTARSFQDVYDYFLTVTTLFKSLDTYKTLARANIKPTSSRTFALADLLAPLTAAHGAPPTLRCEKSRLDEIWYHFDVLGSVQTGKFIPAAPDGTKSNCPSTGIEYLPKSSPTTTKTATATETNQPTSSAVPGTPFEGKGNLNIFPQSSPIPVGCLISQGYWYVSGTCAKFHVQDDAKHLATIETEVDTETVSAHPLSDEDPPHLFTLHSSKGPCSIYQGHFQCAKNIPTQSVFGHNGTALTYQGSSRFLAAKIPGKYEKAPVSPYTEEADHGDVIELEIHWL